MVFDIATGEDVSPVLYDINEEDDHRDADQFNDNYLPGISHLVLDLLLCLLA